MYFSSQQYHKKHLCCIVIPASRLGNILNQLGIPPSSLSQSGTVSLRTLTNIALLLDVKDASNSRYE